MSVTSALRTPTSNWELAAIFGTALGTTLLALSTGALAWSTRSEVRATQRLAELTQEQQAANDRPVLILQQRASFAGTPENGVVQLRLQNVGLGPALRVRLRATYDDADWNPGTLETTVGAVVANTAVPVEMPVSFPPPNKPGGVRGDGFSVEGDYLDRSLKKEYPLITAWPDN
jgi:hypothetical protein